MKTESHSINDVLAKNATSFFIPPFQRAYAWGRPEIERYFNDVTRIVESELNQEQRDKLEHFFGTLVIKEEKAGFANKSVVVDGQQRLTTTLIFLIALRDLEQDEVKKDLVTQTYLINNTSTFQDTIKLKQVTKDWEAYRALVNQSELRPGIISNAYLLFTKYIKENKKRNPEILLDHYLLAIQRMNVAVIFLDERPFKGEDPQIIFETLNSLGKPLTLSDLVRNFVLLNMNSEEQTNVYEKVWHPRIENVLKERTSKFFRDYLQYKTASSIKVVSVNNTKEVYHLFKSYVENKFYDHNDFIEDIVRYVEWYDWITSEVVTDVLSVDADYNKNIIELIRNIFHDIKAEAFKPFVLGLFEYHQQGKDGVVLSDELFHSILTYIRTYLIRRRILGLTQGENKNIVLLSDQIEKLAKREIEILGLLTNLFYRLRLPNDSEMTSELVKMNFYERLKKYSKFILGKIEENNTKVAVNFRDSRITIEHVMPQKLTNSWKEELGVDFNDTHKKYLHNIGNVILTEFNSEIGNKPFSTKKEKLQTSSLNYRLHVIDEQTWNADTMLIHQKKMIAWLLDTFSLPINYRASDNWNTSIVESNTFSPTDAESGEMAEGNKPEEIRIDGINFSVRTWQDVFLKFIQHIKESSAYDFGILLDNQRELFKKDDVLLNWESLESLIDDNIDLSGRYKTLEGKVWKKARELKNDTLFVHIHFSAVSCMNRLSNIMDKFSMERDSVEIVLR